MDWLLVLGLEEGLVECATLCVKSWVILWGSLHISHLSKSISRLMATRDFLVHASSSRKTMWFKTSFFPLLKLPFQCVYNLFFFVFFLLSSSILIFRVQTRMETNYFFFHGRKKKTSQIAASFVLQFRSLSVHSFQAKLLRIRGDWNQVRGTPWLRRLWTLCL